MLVYCILVCFFSGFTDLMIFHFLYDTQYMLQMCVNLILVYKTRFSVSRSSYIFLEWAVILFIALVNLRVVYEWEF